jgi:hypothetical protein
MMRPDPATLPFDLFEEAVRDVPLDDGAVLLGGFARGIDVALLAALANVVHDAPFRHMVTPGGWPMSVAMTNCGDAGWVTDRGGYRYDPIDPETGRRWPAMPAVFMILPAARPRQRGLLTLRRTPASSTATWPGRAFRCIRTGMSATSAVQSSQFRSAFPPPSSGVGQFAPPARGVCRFFMAMWSFGAAPRA